MVTPASLAASSVGLILTTAAVAKLISRSGFNVTIRSLMPARWTHRSRVVALCFILVELAIGLTCVVPPTRTLGLGLSFFLVLGFLTLSIGSALQLVDVPCACFGGPPRPMGGAEVTRNVLLLILNLMGWLGTVLLTGPIPQPTAIVSSVIIAILVLAIGALSIPRLRSTQILHRPKAPQGAIS